MGTNHEGVNFGRRLPPTGGQFSTLNNNAWAEQKVIREIMVFLHSHGVGTARAVRIFRRELYA